MSNPKHTRSAMRLAMASLLLLTAGCGEDGEPVAGQTGVVPIVAAIDREKRIAVMGAVQQPAASGATLDTHAVLVDEANKLMSWVTPQDKAFDRVSFLSWDLLLNRMPVDPANGLKVYFTHSEYDPDTFAGSGWHNNPAGKNAMLAESAALYYAYSGNRGVINLVSSLLDHQLQHGTTPSNFAWANVPWSTGAGGSVTYGNDGLEGVGVLEPDKVGELGFHGYLRFWQITGDLRYRDAAIACADALVQNIRAGSATQSPWPYRVRAQNGQVVEDYTAHVIAPIQLFDELIRLDLGNVAGYISARQIAWNWLMSFPMVTGRWTQYFEDVPIGTDPFWNLNQYAPGQTARYLLDNPDKDPNWQSKVAQLINFIEANFGGDDKGDPGLYFGARVISEQNAYKFKMASHTSRFGAVNALYAAATGDATAKDKALRSLNWATYMARSNGSVNEGPAEFSQNRPFWFTDGHGDYVRHFMLAMGAFPEWAPTGENHLLRSSSIVSSVSYISTAIDYRTHDVSSTEVFRLGSAPVSVSADGIALNQRTDLASEGWTYDVTSGVLIVRHDAATQIRVAFYGVPALPIVSTIVPTDGSTAVGTGSVVSATFSQPMDVSTVTASTFALSSPSGQIPATVTYNTSTRVATLTPSAALATSTTYTATVTGGAAGVKDSAGNALATDRTWSFTTVAGDVTPPTVTTIAPASGAAAVALNSTVAATFSEAMNAGTISGSTFQLRNPGGTAVAATVTYNTSTRVATLTPSAALATSTTYTATVTGGAAGVKDSAGNALATDRTWSFTTQSAAPVPTLVVMGSSSEGTTTDYITEASSAYINANRVQVQTAATITTIRAKVGAIAGKYRIAIYADSGGAPGALLAETGEVNATVTGWQSYRLVSTLPVVAGQWYWIAIWSNDVNARVYASSGSLRWGAYPYSASWPSTLVLSGSAPFAYSIYASDETVAGDVTPPTVTTIAPASGAAAVALNSTVAATFSEAMNAGTISGSTFQLRNPGGTAVAATVTYNTSTRVATLTPSAALATSTTYTATVTGGAAGVKDSAGNALATDRTWSFTTVAGDVTPPTVTTIAPASGAAAVALSSTVAATFSEAMNAGTISGSTFQLRNPGGTAVAATVTYNTSTRVATLTPSAALATSTTYTATVTGGAAGVKDSAGNALATDRTWSFTTVAGDVTPPTVTTIAPASGAAAVALSSTVAATFSEAMNAGTISGSTFQLRNPGGTAVAATVTYNTSTRVATLTPSAALATSTTYTATVTGGAAGVKDSAGNALATDRTWSFTTVAGDVTPPTVTTIAPASGAAAVALSSTVAATFSEAMNAGTISGSTFQLRNPGGTAVAATVTYNTSTRVATLTPSAALATSTTYTATVTGGAAGVKDSAGNALATNRTWSFTTQSAAPVPTLVVMGSSSEGTTTDYITEASSAYINANRVQVQTAATITTIRAKVGAIAGKYRIAIYADSGGAPGALLAETGEVNATVTGWQSYRLVSTLPVVAGQWYWIAVWSNDVNARVYASSGSLRWGAYPYSASWPNLPVLQGSAPFAYSIFASTD